MPTKSITKTIPIYGGFCKGIHVGCQSRGQKLAYGAFVKECMPAFVLSGRDTTVFNEFDDKDYCEDFVKEFTCDANKCL